MANIRNPERLGHDWKCLMVLCLDARMEAEHKRFSKRLIKLASLGLVYPGKLWELTPRGKVFAEQWATTVTVNKEEIFRG